MTFFEYVMVMVSLVLALAVSHVMRASADIFGGAKRYWVHSAWCALLVYTVFQTWWAYWDLKDTAEWTFAIYLAMFPYPLMLFMTASILVPLNRPQPVDWKAVFFERRQWFFGVQIALVVEAIITPVLLFDAPPWHLFRFFQLGLVVLMTIGMLTRSERGQGVIVVVNAAWELSANFLARYELGALAGG